MIDLQINIGNLQQEFSLGDRQVDNMLGFVVEEVAAGFARNWYTEANVLVKSREEYQRSIQVESIDQFTKAVFLTPDAFLPNAIETGMSEMDMKIGFFNSPKAKTGKDGKKWLTIPFRIGTPDIQGDNPLFAAVMPKEIHNLVLQNEQDNPVQQESSGLPFSKIPSEYQMPQSSMYRKALKSDAFAKIEEGTAMTSLYSGLKRNAKGSGYVIFRRVSENSEADKFIHPGIMARNLGQKAKDSMDIPAKIDESVDTFLYSLKA